MFKRFRSMVLVTAVAAATLVAGCSSDTKAGVPEQSVQLQNMSRQQRYLYNNSIDVEHKYVKEGDKRKWYVACPDGASSRLLAKWLRMEHSVSDPDVCVPFADVVKLVARELPRLHAYIDEYNRQSKAEWDAYRGEILGITQKGPDVAAPELLGMLCGDARVDNPVEHSVRQWTPFRTANPLDVWLVIKRIQILDEYGYATEVVKTDPQYGDVEYRDDEWFYQVAIKREPVIIGGGYFPYYGDIGEVPTQYLIESAYEGMRALGADYNLPTTIYDGPYCPN